MRSKKYRGHKPTRGKTRPSEITGWLALERASPSPSLHSHYKNFFAPTGWPASVPRIGTLALVGPPREFLPWHRGDRFVILKNTDLWDDKAWVLQVTNATERTVELRALMGAQEAPTPWKLRCEVREKILEFIQRNYLDGLSKVRAEIRESVTPAPAMIESKS